jgi:hypothetical protein
MPGFSFSFRLAAAALLVTLAARTAAAEPPPPERASALPPPPDPIGVEGGAHVGFVYRIGDGPSFPVDGRAGGTFGLTAAVSPWKRATVGLGWEHTTIGSERGQGELADVAVSRSLDVFWASVKLFVVRTDGFGFFVELGPGLAIQHASADVLVYPQPGMQLTAYQCSASGGPGIALRAGLGVEARIVGGLWFSAGGVFDHVQASSGPLDDCVPGAGSLALVGGRLGLAYRHDVTRWLR